MIDFSEKHCSIKTHLQQKYNLDTVCNFPSVEANVSDVNISDKHGCRIENGGTYLMQLYFFQAIIALFLVLHVEYLASKDKGQVSGA